MIEALSLLAAIAIGFGAAVQTSMLGAMGRARGPSEAAWLSVLTTVCGLAVLLGSRAWRGDPPLLPFPLDRLWLYIAVALVTGAGVLLGLRGLHPSFAVSGLFGLAFIIGAATIAPRIGIALFISAAIAGQLIGAMTMDQIGAFGAAVHGVTPMRLAGAALLLTGVVLVRGIGR